MRYAITRSADADAAYAPNWAPLLASNQATVGDAEGVPFALTLTTGDDLHIHGGLWAMSLWGSFYIALVIVPQGARGLGLGSQMMRQAEDQARAWGCHNMWLDTFAFQARHFYEGLGFSVFGELEGPPPAFPRYFMRKAL